MRFSSFTPWFSLLALALSACASSTPAPESQGGSEVSAKAASKKRTRAKAATKDDGSGGDSVPAELAEMLEPRTCQPTLLTGTHFRELKDSKGQKHRAFLIAPGEELCLVGSNEEKGDGALANLELSEDPVPLERAKERLISVELRTLEMGSVLVVKNHHRATLQFHGSMALPHQLDLVSTSVCPVMPGRFSVEHWPDPLSSLLLTDFSLHDPKEQLGCE
jgi:hypothetical protein